MDVVDFVKIERTVGRIEPDYRIVIIRFFVFFAWFLCLVGYIWGIIFVLFVY